MDWAKSLLIASLTFIPLTAQTPASLIAPTGTLRAAFLGDNPALGKVDKKTGRITGPVADFVREMGRRLSVPTELYPASGTPEIISRLNANTSDIGFFAYNAGRAAQVDFTPAWLLMPNTYIVRADSQIQKVADADRAGIHIQAVKNDTQDVYLSKNLTNTTVDAVAKMPEGDEIEKALLNGKIDAFAANKQRLVEIGAKYPTLHVVADDYFVAAQAVAIAKDNPERLDAITKLLNEILATSLVKDSVARAGLGGVNAAPVGWK